MQKKSVRYNLGDPEDYNPIILSRWPESDLRMEYSRLRKTALSRLNRIEKSGEFPSESKMMIDRFEDIIKMPPSKIKGTDLPSALADLARTLNARTSTLTGLRHKRASTLEGLKESGIKGINKGNYMAFTQFMKATQIFRNAYIPYPKKSESTRAMQDAKRIRPKMFQLTQARISQAAIIKNFKFFQDNLGAIEGLIKVGKIKPDRARPYSANEIRIKLGMEPDRGQRSAKAAVQEASEMLKGKRRK